MLVQSWPSTIQFPRNVRKAAYRGTFRCAALLVAKDHGAPPPVILKAPRAVPRHHESGSSVRIVVATGLSKHPLDASHSDVSRTATVRGYSITQALLQHVDLALVGLDAHRHVSALPHSASAGTAHH